MRRPLTPVPVAGPVAAVRALRGWNAAVAASAAVLVTLGLAFGIGWLATNDTRTSNFALASPPTSVDLELSSGDAQISGGSPSAVQVERIDRFAFGRSAHEQRSLSGGVLRLSSRCPHVVVGSCSSSYRLTVPDNVAVKVRSASGSVRLSGFRGNARIETRSGAITVDAFCGFGLSATSSSGNVKVTTACAAKSIDLESDTGNVSALVPPGRYDVRATARTGKLHVSGVTRSPDAPFSINLFSRSGDVSLEGGL